LQELVNDGVRLIAATLDLLNAEEISGRELATRLNLAPPPSWPPEHNDAATRAWFAEKLRDDPANDGWVAWYVIARYAGAETLAGTAGFTGKPENGVVEVGYAIIPELQRRGIATKAVAALCRKAFADPAVTAVTARTFPNLFASQGVLRKAGFTRIGEATDPAEGVIWTYRLDRP